MEEDYFLPGRRNNAWAARNNICRGNTEQQPTPALPRQPTSLWNEQQRTATNDNERQRTATNGNERQRTATNGIEQQRTTTNSNNNNNN